MTLEIVQIPCLTDNFAYLVHDRNTALTAAIDTPDVDAILEVLNERDWKLTHIFNTHHHHDHVGGNLEIKEKTGCTIIGSENDQARIPGVDVKVHEGDELLFGEHKISVYETPGHTLGHIVYHFPNDSVAFVGDTLFSLGCGRLFEGSPEQMWDSLQKIMRWSEDTLIYCAHEYTLANAQFALSIEPENVDLLQRYEVVQRLIDDGKPTVPSQLGLEKKTNPFLRPTSHAIQSRLGLTNVPLAEVFGEIRKRKDSF